MTKDEEAKLVKDVRQSLKDTDRAKILASLVDTLLLTEPNKSTESIEKMAQDIVLKALKNSLYVLIVDDEEVIRQTLEMYLEESKLCKTIEFACDGKEAMERLSSKSYDLLVVDNKMPSVSGMNVIKQLRDDPSRPSQVPIVFISGYFENRHIKSAAGRGVVHTLSKPFSQEEFLTTIKDALVGLHHDDLIKDI